MTIEEIMNYLSEAIDRRINSWHLNTKNNPKGVITFLIPGSPIKRYRVTVEEVAEIPLDYEIDERGFEKE